MRSASARHSSASRSIVPTVSASVAVAAARARGVTSTAFSDANRKRMRSGAARLGHHHRLVADRTIGSREDELRLISLERIGGVHQDSSVPVWQSVEG